MMVMVIICHSEQDTRKARHGLLSILTFVGWEIGTSVEWATVGSKEDGHGPATLLCKGLHGLHIDFVYIWSFFTIYFNRDKMLIHEASDVFILEGFALHDMAPVAGRVANTEQDGFVLLLRLLQGFFAPWVPIYGVVRVLQEVWACLVDEPVGMFMLRCRVCGFGHDSSGGGHSITFFWFFLFVVLMGVLYHIGDSLIVGKLLVYLLE